MHNSTIAKDVNGVSTPYIFDTFQAFGRNDTVTKLQEVKQDWYLFPSLAGNLTVNGTVTLHAFVSVSLVNSQINPSLTVSEINSTGAANWSVSQNYGSVSWWADPHDLVLTIGAVHHTFSAGSSILVLLDITSGSRIVTIWYNASWVPTHLVVQSDDFARIESIAFLDSKGVPRMNFNSTASNQTITIQVNVTDPLGGYDIRWVNLTLQKPGGSYAFQSAPMTKTAGTPLSYVSTYELTWNYSKEPLGRYNVTASVLDNSGFYYFEEFFATDGFLSQLDAFFYIGGLPVYVNVKTIDSEGFVLRDATVILTSGNVAVDSTATDAYGMANMTMAKGIYTFKIIWQGVLVASQVQNVTGNVTSSNPLAISCRVYYPIFQVQDAAGAPLSNALVYVVHPNGTHYPLAVTGATGNLSYSQVPGGAYGITVIWHDSVVYSQPAQSAIAVAGNVSYPVVTQVYNQGFQVVQPGGVPIPLASVVVENSTTGVFVSFGITNDTGMTTSRVPVGTFTVLVYWQTSIIATVQNLKLPAGTNPYIITASLYRVTFDAVDAKGLAVAGAEISIDNAGGHVATLVTNGQGNVTIVIPGGPYTFKTSWEGVVVNTTVSTITTSTIITLNLAVYYLSVNVVGNDGSTLSGVFLQVVYQGAGAMVASATTTSQPTVFRLPVGQYVVTGTYHGTFDMSPVNQTVNATVPLTSSKQVTLVFTAVNPAFTSTAEFAVALGFAILAALLAFLVFLLLRRRPPKSAAEPQSSPAPPAPLSPSQMGPSDQTSRGHGGS